MIASSLVFTQVVQEHRWCNSQKDGRVLVDVEFELGMAFVPTMACRLYAKKALLCRIMGAWSV